LSCADIKASSVRPLLEQRRIGPLLLFVSFDRRILRSGKLALDLHGFLFDHLRRFVLIPGMGKGPHGFLRRISIFAGANPHVLS